MRQLVSHEALMFIVLSVGAMTACSSGSATGGPAASLDSGLPPPRQDSGTPAVDTGIAVDSGVAADAAADSGASPDAAPDASQDPFNQPGNLLISDQFNNRVIELDSQGRIVWQFGDGSSTPGPTSIVGPNDIERVGDKTLIAGTGAPAGSEASCTSDCLDNRVILVDRTGSVVWQYGQAGVAGSGPDQLNTPAAATSLPNGHVLIADQGNQRVIEVDSYHHIVWQYGTTGVAGAGDNQLNAPNSAELLANGNVLIAEQANHRVVEVTHALTVAWSYGNPNDSTTLDSPNFACRLANGNTLIADGGGHSLILEVSAAGQVVWQFATNARAGSTAQTDPSNAVRLQGGHTLITDKGNDQVLEVDSSGSIVRTVGTIGVAGNGPDQLNQPYNARVVGDYTGITPPM